MIIFLSFFMLFSFNFYSKQNWSVDLLSGGKERIYLLMSKLAEDLLSLPAAFSGLSLVLALGFQPLEDSNELSRKQEISSNLGDTWELTSLLLLEDTLSLWGQTELAFRLSASHFRLSA